LAPAINGSASCIAPPKEARAHSTAVHDHRTHPADSLTGFGRTPRRTISSTVDSAISGAKGRDKRPGLDGLLKVVARRDVDMVAAWSVDRLGRSLIDLLDFLRELHAKSVDLFPHQQGLDTSTPSGRAMFQMLGVFAEFERAMIRERVTEAERVAAIVVGTCCRDRHPPYCPRSGRGSGNGAAGYRPSIRCCCVSGNVG
jgi:hypothetical protein